MIAAKSKILFLTAAGVAFLLIAYSLHLYKKPPPPIEVGAILSITGPASNAGIEVQKGMSLAIDLVNEQGGIHGRPLVLHVEDSGTDAKTGQEAFLKLEQSVRPLFYVSTTSRVSTAVAPLAEQNRAPLVALVSTSPLLTRERSWIFKYYTSPETEAKPILRFLRGYKLKSLGVLYLNDDYGAPVYNYIADNFKGSIKAIPFSNDDLNFQEKLESLSGFDAVYIVGFSIHIKQFLQISRLMNYKGKILLCNSLNTRDLNNLPEAEGAYIATANIYNDHFLFARRISELYQKKFGGPLDHFSANGYNFITLLGALLENSRPTREEVKNVLEDGFYYPGIFGDIQVEKGSHDINLPLNLAKIIDGKFNFLF